MCASLGFLEFIPLLLFKLNFCHLYHTVVAGRGAFYQALGVPRSASKETIRLACACWRGFSVRQPLVGP